MDALASRLAPLVIAHLARALGALGEPYSTRKGREPPEYVGRRERWKEDAPRIPGAVKLGRWWTVRRRKLLGVADRVDSPPPVHHHQPTKRTVVTRTCSTWPASAQSNGRESEKRSRSAVFGRDEEANRQQ